MLATGIRRQAITIEIDGWASISRSLKFPLTFSCCSRWARRWDFLSGMFGVGGGFLITPLLIFYNIPPAIAVATGANQVIASSFSGALAHVKRGTLDFKLGRCCLPAA